MLPSNATEHAPSIATQQCHGRTDGRTDADELTVRVNRTAVSRAGGHRILRGFEADSEPTAASRVGTYAPRRTVPRPGDPVAANDEES